MCTPTSSHRSVTNASGLPCHQQSRCHQDNAVSQLLIYTDRPPNTQDRFMSTILTSHCQQLNAVYTHPEPVTTKHRPIFVRPAYITSHFTACDSLDLFSKRTTTLSASVSPEFSYASFGASCSTFSTLFVVVPQTGGVSALILAVLLDLQYPASSRN